MNLILEDSPSLSRCESKKDSLVNLKRTIQTITKPHSEYNNAQSIIQIQKCPREKFYFSNNINPYASSTITHAEPKSSASIIKYKSVLNKMSMTNYQNNSTVGLWSFEKTNLLIEKENIEKDLKNSKKKFSRLSHHLCNIRESNTENRMQKYFDNISEDAHERVNHRISRSNAYLPMQDLNNNNLSVMSKSKRSIIIDDGKQSSLKVQKKLSFFDCPNDNHKRKSIDNFPTIQPKLQDTHKNLIHTPSGKD